MLNRVKDRTIKQLTEQKDINVAVDKVNNENIGNGKVMKGYKITDNDRSRKFGIGANSLEMLRNKANSKFPIQDLRLYLAVDGIEIMDEDYFSTLESQTLFVVGPPNFIIITEDEFKYEQLRQRSVLFKVSDIIYNFMELHPDKFRKMILEYEKRQKGILKDNCKTELSLKSEHNNWFMGQEEKCQTKEEALAKRAQDRVRGYYYKTKDDLTHTQLYRQNKKVRAIIDSTLEKFRYLLIGCDYFSMIFDRKCQRKHAFVQEKLDDDIDAGSRVPSKKLKQIIKEYTTRQQILDEWSVSLCTNMGDFYCQGPYSTNANYCPMQHTINPYASRENLILFQVWNLDHQIELSRTILPTLLNNILDLINQQKSKRVCTLHNHLLVDISVLEYFLEIFSLKNLKLVHIVCHEKVQRHNKSNGRLLCKKCPEYQIVAELMDIKCPEAAIENW